LLTGQSNYKLVQNVRLTPTIILDRNKIEPFG